MRIVLLLLAILAAVALGHSAPLGFLPENGPKQLELERRFDALLNADHLREWMEKMTSRPHHAGSKKAKENAEFIAQLLREWGYEVEIEVFHVLLPTPKTRELQLLRPIPFRPSLTERIVVQGPIAEVLQKEALPPYNAYSGEGEVIGPLVYVNQGLPEDYESLERHGIDVKGKIVIARYGGSWRGIKPKVAAEQGAIGCIIYNDPLADGFAQGASYPAGAYKHDTAVQRGSVIDLPVRPGDPLTPGYGATPEATRLPIDEAETIMKIPVLPISSVDAEPLFRTLDGPVAPSSWRGALPVTYRLGGKQSIVRLKLEFNWETVPTYNVIARKKGSHYPDQWVLRGNHHDAWVIGARDPISGTITVLEEARAASELMKTGWQPKHTLVYCLWDAEEPGLLGSTEWVEHHAEELRDKAVAYINTDGNSRGFLRIGGSHTLETLAGQVALNVKDPLTSISVSERLRSAQLTRGSAKQKEQARASSMIALRALGSGSDYSAFLQHLGIASFYVGFGGEGVGGEYHTCFDTFDHYTRFIDPDFNYGLALTKFCGRLTLRLSEAEILPFNFAACARTVSGYVDEVVELMDSKRTQTDEFNTLIQENRFTWAADPTETYVPPSLKEPVPHLNFSPLLNARNRFTKRADQFGQQLQPFLDGQKTLAQERLRELNRILFQSERAFIDSSGLPNRPWYRHRIYAPGLYTGYGVKTLPGVREAIEQEQWSELERQINRTAAALEKMADTIDQASALLSAATIQPVSEQLRDDLKLARFYQKHIDLDGFPVLGSANVSDHAMLEAAWIVGQMLTNRTDILRALADNDARLVVMAYNEYTTDIPEQANMTPKVYWDRRARGLGGRIASCAEENMLCFPGDPYSTENILVHEFAHVIHGVALRALDGTFNRRLREAYRTAMDAGLWKGTYAATNPGEYWAENVQNWFDNNRYDDALHNHVHTRAQLKEYDPAVAALCQEVFGDIAWRYQKPMERAPSDRAHLAGYDPSQAPQFEWRKPPVPEKPKVSIETALGRIEVELDPKAAPHTVTNFLHYVQEGLYNDGQFHRSVTLSNQPTNLVKIEVIQASANQARTNEFLPPIKLERTRDTGLKHLDGTISMARKGPDTAQDHFFICIGDQPELDFGGKRNPDGQGFAAFGKVVRGMDVVRKIQAAPSEEQTLTPPVRIQRTLRSN